jgi:hypothetical protein
VKQKHVEADRMADLSTRVDELIRELVKIHLVLNPAAATLASAPAPGTPEDAAAASTGGSSDRNDLAGSRGSNAGACAGGVSGGSTVREGAGGDGGGRQQPEVLSSGQLAAELAAGWLAPHWSPEEDLENMLLTIQPGDIKVGSLGTHVVFVCCSHPKQTFHE